MKTFLLAMTGCCFTFFLLNAALYAQVLELNREHISKPRDLESIRVFVDDDYDSATPGWGVNRFDTIRAGILAARSGMTVYVYAGTYYELLWVNKAITLQGEDPEVTVIDGYQLGNVVTLEANGSSIRGFTVRNCYQNSPSGSAGVLVKADNTTVEDNIICDNFPSFGDIAAGVSLVQMNGCVVKGNLFRNNDRSVQLVQAQENRVEQCWFEDNVFGVYDAEGSSNIIFNNIMQNSELGIYLYYSDGITIHDNLIENNEDHGICLYNSTTLTAYNNDFNDGGIMIKGENVSAWNTHDFQNNRINTKPIYYFKDQDYPIAPLDACQVILANCNHAIVQDLTFTGVAGCIQMGFCTNGTVTGNTVNQSKYDCIYLEGSDDNVISYNQVTYANCKGLYVFDSDRNTLTDNSLNGTTIGIFLYESKENLIQDNLIENTHQHGVRITYSDTNTVFRNTITSSGDSGVEVYYSEAQAVNDNNLSLNQYGINIHGHQDGHVIQNNTISNSTFYGVEISGSDIIFSGNTIEYSQYKGLELSGNRGLIYDNIFQYNNDDGLRIIGSENFIYHNDFIENGTNAELGSGSNNQWDDGYPSGGNYWDHHQSRDYYSGPGQDEPGPDGIGDDPCPVSGGSGNQDNYPMMSPFNV